MRNKKLVMTIGLPGSGKTYWAVEEATRLRELGKKVYISSKDDIREELVRTSDWIWSPKNEKDVLAIQNKNIREVLSHDEDITVIVADTNFGKHKSRLEQIAASCKAEFEVKDFTAVPLETCIERDAIRKKSVGQDVIKDMYMKYVHVPVIEPYKPDWLKPISLICDLDGTIALHGTHRSPYDWKKCGYDLLNEPVANAVKLFAASAGYTIIYCSGRDEGHARTLSENWLQQYQMPFGGQHKLFMRPAGDTRKDYIVKQELFDSYIRKEYNVRFVLDDRDQVVQMWRKLGLSTWQVNEGNF